ncbi:tol-pal system-associated acyl-CoA thioesterase [Legionella hackeliae]|uniref:Acyl-CoA thioesterase n=1 Tax=Legionella hackeliae TaxID=449 RepID=A0A0A8UU90_LEGHA|nr:tol-pal system-associated acyl-CoA thioesterase [Legionella hackeliae]KTD13903.1 acyl-CoA thioesterase [Legionella hackeliae]CEK10607.1 acyl-CoA thioesterase [Legionella hackeliae]STX47349.1 acyl-CoA thioesterase [Legionella hackeliae]
MNDHYRFDIRVYAEDTDMMGIVYHANYLRFFERARTEMIRASGLSLSALATYDCHFAINEVKLRYVAPARLDDWLTVVSKIDTKTSCSLVFEQNIYNQDNKLLCQGLIKVVCIDGRMKPKRIPENLFEVAI